MTHLQKVFTSVGVLFGGLLFFLWWRRPPKQKPKLKDKPPSELNNHTPSSQSAHTIQNSMNQNSLEQEMIESKISEIMDKEVGTTPEIKESELDRIEEMIQENRSTVLLECVPSATADGEKTKSSLDETLEEVMVEEEILVSESVQNVSSAPFISDQGNSNTKVRGSDFDISNIAVSLESEERPSLFNEAFVTSCVGNNSVINRSNDDKDKTSNTEDTVSLTLNSSTCSKICDEQDKTRDCPDLSLSTSTMEPLLESTTIEAVRSSVADSDFSFDSSSAAKEDQMTRVEGSMSVSAENYNPNLSDTNMRGDNCVHTDQHCGKSNKVTVSQEESLVNTRLHSFAENGHKTTNEKKLSNKNFKNTSKSACKTSKHSKTCNENDSASEDMVSSRDSTPENDHQQTNSSKCDGDNMAINSDSNSSNCDSASNDSGRGSSLVEGSKGGKKKYEIYQFNFPTACCGRLIGKYGKNINWIKDRTGANISLTNHPYTSEFQLCVIEGTKRQIDDTLRIIGRKFPDVDLNAVQAESMSPESTSPKPSSNGKPVLVQEIMQLNLPEGVSIDVIVSSIVDAGHVFLQQPTHPTFPSLERLNQYMIACYTQDGIVPQLPRPLESGVICAAPMLNGWYRAQITNVYEETDECDIKYVDYGGFSRVQGCALRQIRSDFMTLPFQAIECYMANVTPLQDEELFSAEAGAVLEELTQGMLLQAQVVGRNDDGIPYIHIYQITGDKVTFVNRELVNRGVTRWIEILS